MTGNVGEGTGAGGTRRTGGTRRSVDTLLEFLGDGVYILPLLVLDVDVLVFDIYFTRCMSDLYYDTFEANECPGREIQWDSARYDSLQVCRA